VDHLTVGGTRYAVTRIADLYAAERHGFMAVDRSIEGLEQMLSDKPDRFAGIVCDSALEYAEDQQRRYREKRRRWAWKIGRPYSGDVADPDPGVLDIADEEVG
jgi:hypothetical protein